MEDFPRLGQQALYGVVTEAVAIADVVRGDENQIALALGEIVAQQVYLVGGVTREPGVSSWR